jgi:uncharacterized protein YdeI (BOF family)
MRKLIIAATLMAFATSALAQSAEFYIVQDTATKKCTIVDKKPTVSTMTVVSPSGTVYKTRTEAETGMKTVKVCESN